MSILKAFAWAFTKAWKSKNNVYLRAILQFLFSIEPLAFHMYYK